LNVSRTELTGKQETEFGQLIGARAGELYRSSSDNPTTAIQTHNQNQTKISLNTGRKEEFL
jgi:hypothetical protein